MPESPKETADGRCQKLCPHTTAYEISGHCRIADTEKKGRIEVMSQKKIQKTPKGKGGEPAIMNG